MEVEEDIAETKKKIDALTKYGKSYYETYLERTERKDGGPAFREFLYFIVGMDLYNRSQMMEQTESFKEFIESMKHDITCANQEPL